MVNLSTQQSFEFETPSPWKPWAIATLAAIIILAIALGLMKALGLFTIPSDEAGAKTIAAALALMGSLLATVVTLVGIVVKYSIDDRNARLAAIEAHRAHELGIEAEQRNRIETAISAVNLLGENNKDSTPHQISGAILALVNLGELELAVSLLAELWPPGLVSPYVARYVLLNAFKSQHDSIAIEASAVLTTNAENIDQNKFHIWPIENLGWNVDLPLNARIGLACSAVTWMTVTLSRGRDFLPTAFIVLYKALYDPDIMVKDIAAAALRPLTKVFQSENGLYTEQGVLTIANTIKRLAELPAEPISNYAQEAAQKISEAIAEP